MEFMSSGAMAIFFGDNGKHDQYDWKWTILKFQKCTIKLCIVTDKVKWCAYSSVGGTQHSSFHFFLYFFLAIKNSLNSYFDNWLHINYKGGRGFRHCFPTSKLILGQFSRHRVGVNISNLSDKQKKKKSTQRRRAHMKKGSSFQWIIIQPPKSGGGGGGGDI